MDQAAAPCYDARALTRMYDHLTTVSRHMNTLGWANYANDHEDANGQFEQNFRYADPLTTADRVIVFRYMVHIAGRRGRDAGHLHAQAVLEPDRQRAAHAPEPVGRDGRHELFADTRRCAGPRHVGLGVLLHRRAAGPRRGAGRGGLPHRQLVQAPGRAGPELGRGLVARLRHLRRERPHAHAARPRPGPGGGPLHRRLGQPLPGHQRADRRRPRRHRARARTRATL